MSMTKLEAIDRARAIWGDDLNVFVEARADGWHVLLGRSEEIAAGIRGRPGANRLAGEHRLDGHGHVTCHDGCRIREDRLGRETEQPLTGPGPTDGDRKSQSEEAAACLLEAARQIDRAVDLLDSRATRCKCCLVDQYQNPIEFRIHRGIRETAGKLRKNVREIREQYHAKTR